MLNAFWPASGLNGLFSHLTFCGPCLQCGLLPILHNTLVCRAFVTREVHFSSEAVYLSAPGSGSPSSSG